jgi:hypothetical protein
LLVVAELIFTVSKLLNVDRLQRHDAAAIADDLSQSRQKRSRHPHMLDLNRTRNH